MSYITLDEYQRKWIFTHQSMPVPAEDLAKIHPMSQARASQLWQENVSPQSPDADRFSPQDWASKESNWSDTIDWMTEWEADEEALPQGILDFIDWQDDVTVYFCYEKYNVIETKWSVFKKHWKNFLFYDDGPILLGRRRSEALWFDSKGKVKLGKRA
ncbi:hypothetical protein BCU68_00530 [Vibrio sp. 10N.286.49.B3]|uniref:DUF2947 domain-containing protein n=1 Tax=Vibrio sp. 10N.286.49.B3 TaxID=1880855 RepID=UPI000C84D8D5|nr:DUF2947 domain-containing protein [Vibrio sp. 10N.286.49.B3]PMH46569.1 hypothetical protein BCU68_00530 [Vibrio sp. 10N.286.49.B3]